MAGGLGAVDFLHKYFAPQLAAGTGGDPEIRISYLLGSPVLSKYILAISIGSVFFGANTYIGNGPNLMVKAIAEQQNIPTPSFLGFIGKFALPFMAPMLFLIWWLFFRS